MVNPIRNKLLAFLVASLLGSFAGLWMTPASAGMLAADQVAATNLQADRDCVKAALERPEVAKQLQQHGVAPKDAEARVDAMTGAEVSALAGRVDALPAAGNLTDWQYILIFLGVIALMMIP